MGVDQLRARMYMEHGSHRWDVCWIHQVLQLLRPLVSRVNQVSHLTERITSWCGPMFRNLGAVHRATKSIQGQLIFP